MEEKIFDRIAKGMMGEWDLEKFRKTHPTLLKAILRAMEESKVPTEDGITDYEYDRIMNWMKDSEEGAQTYFTEGKARNLAREIEDKIKDNFQEKVPSVDVIMRNFRIMHTKHFKTWLTKQLTP